MKGIGSWSADVYLLMAMRRADIWPAGDLALAVAMKDLKGLERPDPDELERSPKMASLSRRRRADAMAVLPGTRKSEITLFISRSLTRV